MLIQPTVEGDARVGVERGVFLKGGGKLSRHLQVGFEDLRIRALVDSRMRWE